LPVLCSFAAACATAPAPVTPTPAVEFAAVIEQARQKVEAGDYPAADRILSDYALRHQGSQEAREVSFWRAMYIVDPANRNSFSRTGHSALSTSISRAKGQSGTAAGGSSTPDCSGVTVGASGCGAETGEWPGHGVHLREEETAALRDQLAKANAELERIKKRLAKSGSITPCIFAAAEAHHEEHEEH
jgi:hypothetical protein